MVRSKKSVTLNPSQKRVFYFASGLLWVTGVVFLYVQYAGQGQQALTSQGHAAQSLSLKIHGAAAIAFLMIFGVLLSSHVPEGWRKNEQRVSGGWVVMACGLLILTGWGLDYIGSEQLRGWNSLIHSVVGVLLPLLIFVHVRLARGRLKIPVEK